MTTKRREDPQFWFERGQLPPSAQEIADVIGREKALYLIGSLPRTTGRSWRVCFYVPKVRMPLDHWLVRLLGYRDAVALQRAFSGMILQPSSCSLLPRLFRNREIHRRFAEGSSAREIAEAFGMTEKHIRAILAENPPEEIAAPCNDDGASTDASGDAGELVGQG